ncbi:MAG: DUF4395 domain-containing protein [Helicobacteraceae bacterium]|jgi:hypothetical protein|nr:DUF4395 domain-containing protein [Helicobacteraceae bacterium]
MAQSCPLAFRQIDGTIARLNALSVFLLLLLSVFTTNPFILLFLGLDFMIRLYGNKRFSPIYQISIALQRIFGFKAEMVDAGAKRLAAHFGLFFVLALLATNLAGLTILMYSAAAVFLFCLSLELLFGYCIGCKIYFIYRKLVPERQ